MPSTPSPVIGSDLRSALVAMVRRRVPESEVEDIVQSTLADALESPHAPRDSESLRRWIFGVAKNKVVDYHRRAGRESFELPEVSGKPALHVEADLLRWAERHLPPGEESRTTLDWMLREGDGEKLESIAEAERVPAPRVRQRVSRLRRHLKAHWQKEVALLATLGVLLTILALVLRKKDEPEPIANENVPRAAELRKIGLEKCRVGDWRACIDDLDSAKKLDPAGDTQPEVRRARDRADEVLSVPPSPSPTTLAPPVPSAAPTLAPPVPSSAPTTSEVSPTKTKSAPSSTSVSSPLPIPTAFSTAAPRNPAPPSKSDPFAPSKKEESPAPSSKSDPFVPSKKGESLASPSKSDPFVPSKKSPASTNASSL